MRKKTLCIILITLLIASVLTGCAGHNNSHQQNGTSDTTSAAYAKLMTYKTDNYSQQSVADFNNALSNGDYSEFSEAYSTVMTDILPEDENYDFIMLTLSASASEIYFEYVEKSDKFGMDSVVKKQTQPVKPLPGEEYIFLKEGPIYDFNFWGNYRIEYTVPDPSILTIGERDNALKTICTEMQKYVDGLSEAEIMSGNIRMLLKDKATELADNVSSDNIRLSCEIGNIEIYNEGTEFRK